MKPCSKCLRVLPLSCFSAKNDKSRPKTTHQSRCKDCIRDDRGSVKLPSTPEEAFWRLVQKSDIPNACWIWQGCRDDTINPDNGYGVFMVKRTVYRAHRFAYELFNGPISDGLIVCHHCDTPPCCNPDHLFLGDHAANAIDSMLKGRKAKLGKIRRGPKLTIPDVQRIKALKGKATAEAVAADFNLSWVYVYEIWSGKKWPDIV